MFQNATVERLYESKRQTAFVFARGSCREGAERTDPQCQAARQELVRVVCLDLAATIIEA